MTRHLSMLISKRPKALGGFWEVCDIKYPLERINEFSGNDPYRLLSLYMAQRERLPDQKLEPIPKEKMPITRKEFKLIQFAGKFMNNFYRDGYF